MLLLIQFPIGPIVCCNMIVLVKQREDEKMVAFFGMPGEIAFVGFYGYLDLIYEAQVDCIEPFDESSMLALLSWW